MSQSKGTVLFREIKDPLPEGKIPGTCWQAEYYVEGRSIPAALAWVFARPGALGARSTRFNSVDYILVADECRLQGVGARLIKEIFKRWPGIMLSAPCSRGGEALREHFTYPAVGMGVFDSSYIRHLRRQGRSDNEIAGMARRVVDGFDSAEQDG